MIDLLLPLMGEVVVVCISISSVAVGPNYRVPSSASLILKPEVKQNVI